MLLAPERILSRIRSRHTHLCRLLDSLDFKIPDSVQTNLVPQRLIRGGLSSVRNQAESLKKKTARDFFHWEWVADCVDFLILLSISLGLRPKMERWTFENCA